MRNVVVFANDMKVADQWLRSSYSGVGRFFVCTSFGDITDILDKCEDEDIEGYILPEFRLNKDMLSVLRHIYYHKKSLWDNKKLDVQRVIDFRDMIQKNFGVYV